MQKHLTIALLAAAVLGIAVGSASAVHLESPNSERGYKIVWTDLKLEAAGNEADCLVMIRGTWERRTFTKTSGIRMARITEARVGTCIRNNMTLLRETLPWEMTYNSFAGTLPNIEFIKVNIIGMAFRALINNVECLARTTTTRPAHLNLVLTSGEIRTAEAERGAGIETSGGFFCSFAGEAHFSGNGAATEEGGGAAPRMRLI